MPAAKTKGKLCKMLYGRGLGGVRRRCRLPDGHAGRHTDLPFLVSMRKNAPHVADKIERDSFQTRGASWGKDQSGEQARKNRQPRWTLKPGDAFYPAHAQSYDRCIEVAAELTLQAYEMNGAPKCPESEAALLPHEPRRGSGLCPICLNAIKFSEFALAERSKAAVDTDHLNPGIRQRHAPGNVAFVHHICNTSKGDRSVPEFLAWCDTVLSHHGFSVKKMRR